MTSVIAVSIAAAGLVFSLSIALLIEELLFGAIFRLFFGRGGWTNQRSPEDSATDAPAAGFEYVTKVASGTVASSPRATVGHYAYLKN